MQLKVKGNKFIRLQFKIKHVVVVHGVDVDVHEVKLIAFA